MRRSLPINRATPTRKLIRKSASAKDIRYLSERVTLDRVLGLTTTNNNGLTCNPYNGVIAYPAGCVIVLYNPRTNSQSHIFNPEKKTLTALAFSSDGKYIASGESGHNPRVRVWEIGETVTQVAELNGHKFSINCVAFSPNLKYLVSIGDQHDMLVNIWNWRSGTKVACNKIGCKVRSVSFAENGSYFVTVGNRHVKFWYFDTEVGSKSNVPTPVAGRSGILGELRNNCFCDVKCGTGDNSMNTYAVTKSGLLCSFNEKRILDRWVELRSSGASSLSVNEKYLFCGCSDGIIRVFHPTTMHFISSLPKPHFLGVDVAAGLDASHMISKDNVRYPHVVSLALDDDNDKLSVVYNDHSLYVWDVHNVKKVGKACSFLFHSACIWGLETYPFMHEELHPCLPTGSFLTCSSDDTIRVWNIDDDVTLNNTFPKNIYSKELLKIIYTDEELSNIQDISSIPVSTSSDMKTGVRCLQVSPDGQLLAAGDRSGNLRVYDLQFVDEIMKIEAHEAEILCVEFSDPTSGYRLLATSSRDRLIHIFDIEKDFALIQTVDDHASSVTAVRFNYDEGVFQLLSCGADKHIMMHTAQQLEDRKGIHFVRENTIAIGKATLYDMDIDPTRKFATTCGQDRNVRVYDIQAVKQTHCYKGAVSEDGTLIKIQLDPSGMYAATSCSDKSVNIYDFEAGECAAVVYGHSELVTGLKFTYDGTRLISVSGDHCIFVWRLAPVFTQGIISRLEELGKPVSGAMKKVNDPMSALRNTFVIPKHGKEDLHDVIEEEFSIADPAIFDEDMEETKDSNGQFDYRFSVGQLPAWAQKQITGEKDNTEANTGFGVSHPSGRWAQRVNAAPMVLTTAPEEKSLSMDKTTISEKESTLTSEGTFTKTNETISNDSVFKSGLPYSSHHKTTMAKSDNVIYIPSSEEEFNAEISSCSLQPTDKEKPKQHTTIAKIKNKLIKKSASDSNLTSSRLCKTNSVESPKSAKRIVAYGVAGSPRQPRKVPALVEHLTSTSSSPKLRRKTVGSLAETVKFHRVSARVLDSEIHNVKSSRPVDDSRESPRGGKLSETSNNGRLFEVHFVEMMEGNKEEGFGSKNVIELQMQADEAINSNAFQVTARSSVRQKQAFVETPRKSSLTEQSETANEQPIDKHENAIDYDSLDEEEDDDLSDSENLHSEHEDAEESLQSPLEQHFEYLSEDSSDENESESSYHVNSSPGKDEKQKKGQSFLSRCRSSISAKFLSRSQKSQAGKSQLSEEQRKRIDSFKRAIDQNQNYGGLTAKSMQSKEAKRVKKLTAKSEPNLSIGIPPSGKVTRKVGNGRRTSGITAESHSDLRSIKEGKVSEDLQSKDRVRQLRGSSTSSISPTEREKTTSDLINMFNQRSSTPKHKMDLALNSQLVNAKNSRSFQSKSPGISPLSSPVKTKSPFVHTKDDRATSHAQIDSTNVIRRKPKKGERPWLQNRPKSLVLSPKVPLEEMVRDLCNQTHSDTEIDDESKIEYTPKSHKLTDDEKPPSTCRRTAENIIDLGNASLLVRNIDIDDSVKSSGSRKSWLDNTVIFADKSLETCVAEEDAKKSNIDLQVVEGIEENRVEENKDPRDGIAAIAESLEQNQPLIKDSNNDASKNTEKDEAPKDIEVVFEAKNEESSIEPVKEGAESVEEMVKECESAIGDLMKSLETVSHFHEKTLSMKDSDTKSKLSGLLSEAYTSILEKAKDYNCQLERGPASVYTKGLDDYAKRVVSALDSQSVENDKTNQVVHLLEHYSDAIVKLVESKLNDNR